MAARTGPGFKTVTWVGLRGLEPLTSSLSGKPNNYRAIIDLGAELALSSASVRRGAPATLAVVTQLGTQQLVRPGVRLDDSVTSSRPSVPSRGSPRARLRRGDDPYPALLRYGPRYGRRMVFSPTVGEFYATASEFARNSLAAHVHQKHHLVALYSGTSLEHLAKACLMRRSPVLITELRNEDSFRSLLTLVGIASAGVPPQLRTVGLRGHFNECDRSFRLTPSGIT